MLRRVIARRFFLSHERQFPDFETCFRTPENGSYSGPRETVHRARQQEMKLRRLLIAAALAGKPERRTHAH
jgi:hypothetical protein